MNRPRVLYLLGLAHTRLAEKNYIQDQLPAALAHQDTLKRTTELMRKNFPNSEWTQKTVSNLYTVRVLLNPANSASILAEALQQGNLTRKAENEFAYKLAHHYYDSASVPVDKSLPLVKDVIQNTDSDTLLARAFALQAYLYAKESQTDTARVLLKHIVDTFPSLPAAPQALYTYADWSESAGDTLAALDSFQMVAEKYYYAQIGRDALTRFLNLMVRTGNIERARQILSRQLDRLPESLIDFIPRTVEDKLGWLWVQVQLESQNSATSLATLRHYILSHQKSKHRAEAYYRMGNLALDMGKLDAALGHFQELAEHYPESALAQKGRLQSARLYFDREEYQKARDIYNRQIPNLSGSFKRTAEEYRIRCEYRLGNLSRGDQLMQSFRSQNDNRPAEARILYERGQVLLKEKRFQEAEKTFERLTDDYDDLPEGGRGELGLARMYVILNKTDEALKTLTRITTEYDNPELLAAAYVNLGDFYYENRQLQNCIVACKRVLNHQQQGREHRLALNLLINAYDDVRLWDQAIAQARTYVDTYPKAGDVMAKRVKIGVFLYYLKEYDRAIDYLTQLKRRVSAETETEIQYWIAKAYADRGHLDTAIAEFLKVRYVCKQTKWPWGVTALYEAGNAYQKLGKYPQARRLYKEIVRERGTSDQFGQVATKKLEEIEQTLNSSSHEAENGTQSGVES
jgi:tetratricopeptide (TPR) repeat protein